MFEWIIELQWITIQKTQDEAKLFHLVASFPLWTQVPSPWRSHSSALSTWWMNEAQKLGGQAGIPEDIGPLFNRGRCQKLVFTSREGEKEVGGEEEDQRRSEQPAFENPNQSLHLLLLQVFSLISCPCFCTAHYVYWKNVRNAYFFNSLQTSALCKIGDYFQFKHWESHCF